MCSHKCSCLYETFWPTVYLSEVLFLSHGGGTGLWGGGGNSSSEGLELRSHDIYLGSAERAKFRTLESYTYPPPFHSPGS